MRAIDADKLLSERMKSKYYHLPNGDIAIPLIDIEHAPTIEQERKKGEWTKNNSCPFCGFLPWYESDIHTLSFCPNCGADMRGEQMKIDNKNKRKAYNNYLRRSGAGLASKYTSRRLPASAVNQMKHKPYGGINHEQGKHGNTCDQVTRSNEAVAGTD